MTGTKRGALIGCGFFAQNHMHAWSQIEGADIVAVCDIDAGKAKAMADAFGVKQHFANARKMLATVDLDFVDIATTAGSHRFLTELAASHELAVICQKPIAEAQDDATAMVEAAKAAGVHFFIHENFRWQKGFRTMKQLIEAGEIGKPHFARFSFRHGYDNYKNQPYLATIERFTILDVGMHLFDLARWFMGRVVDVSCKDQHLNSLVRGEDAFVALLGHEGGATSVADCSFHTKLDPEPFPQTMAWIEGPDGTLELNRAYALTLHRSGRHETINVEPEIPIWGAKPWHAAQQSVVAFQTHVIETLNGVSHPQPSGADNWHTLAVALACYQSAETRQTIKL